MNGMNPSGSTGNGPSRPTDDAILRALATGILMVDGHGFIGYLNPAAEQVLGLDSAEVVGRPLATALPDRLAGLRALIVDSLAQGQGRSRCEVEVASYVGRRLPLGASTNVLTNEGDGHGIVAVFQDLTPVRDMERRARRNETLAEVGALAAGIAHELRNGLKPLTGSVEMLQKELKLQGEHAELMDLVVKESARLNKFVTDLLTYSRERDLARDWVEIGDLMTGLVHQLRQDPRCAAGLQVVHEPGPVPVRVLMDAEQMRQVWLNLAFNALEALGERGTLTVRWSTGSDGQLTIEFEDDGPGMDPEDLSHAGEPFFTTKRGGTGLGLAIAQRIVERHSGVLTLESEVGRGTTVRVQLPGAEPSAQAA